MKPILVTIPDNSLLAPSEDAAVVGGNVLTSQRIVDLIFKTFSVCSGSQGCMNNITFGNEKWGYYETVGGGAGAGPSWHGRHGVHTHMTNTRITGFDLNLNFRKYLFYIINVFRRSFLKKGFFETPKILIFRSLTKTRSKNFSYSV